MLCTCIVYCVLCIECVLSWFVGNEKFISLWKKWVVLRRTCVFYVCRFGQTAVLRVYLLLVYLVTALVPSLTACLASSPGRRRRTAVWISRLVMVERLL